MKEKYKVSDSKKIYTQVDNPLYPVRVDIFNNAHNEIKIDPEDISTLKSPMENGLEEDTIAMELYEPGADLDDAEEEVDSEDEENNYYSIGGDGHNDLEEDNNKNY